VSGRSGAGTSYRDPVGAAAYAVSVGGWSPYQRMYDLPSPSVVQQTYLIATTQRSGSHLLAHALARCGAGIPLEYVNPFLAELELMERGDKISDPERIALLLEIRQRRTTATGVFGLKAHWHHWEKVITDRTTFEIVNPTTIIHLQRRDLLAQAVSLALARRTGSWISFHTTKAGEVGPFNAQLVAEALEDITREQVAWEAWFEHRKVQPLRLCFEHIVADPQASAMRAARHVGVVSAQARVWTDTGAPLPRRQRDPVKNEWLARARDQWESTDNPSPRAHCCD